MTRNDLHSVRMRASVGGKHISGAERIVSSDAINSIVNELVARAMSKHRTPDQIAVQIENLGNISPLLLTALDVVTIDAADPETGRPDASRVLHLAGVSNKAVDAAIAQVLGNAAPSGGNMRGAMIMDAETGERLEPDRERGVRASRFDWTENARVAVDRLLSGLGLTHFRVREALAFATKVVHAPGVIAELCWSDDPDYTAGYAASIKTGYVRFPFLKEKGDTRGGRAIFVNRKELDLTVLLHYLQTEAVLINAVGIGRDVVDSESYFSHMRSRSPLRQKGLDMFKQELVQLGKQHLLRRLLTVESYNGSYITINGKRLLLMCSNDYLGLAGHPALREAASAAMERYGFGSGASRLVSGTSALHRELEHKIALFKGTEAALTFNSGYAANTGIIPAIAGEGDVILSDSLNHASIIDGCRLSKAEVKVYRHNDSEHVEDFLRKNFSAKRTLIVTDGVFSMDGDIAPVPELVFLAEKYGALLMVDDAHATGVLGHTGRGTAEHFGLPDRVPVQMGTLGKALGSFGAFAAGGRALIDYLMNRSRSFIFSTALPPMVCAAAIAALDIVDREPERREKLRKNKERFVQGLLSLGIVVAASETPIVPIMIGDPEKALLVGEKLMEYGIYAAAIRPPTVPEGSARIRTTITATHVAEDIDKALGIFDRLKREGYL